ncbi:ETHYLENE-INSENSITIVE3-like 1 protein isoform X1 [Iris pallida]|uniref:ETHYLENE-INSENSITIVE3-like 1 protein isoform X1 n=1 Tax=Iris pallida TaxID=29817 RepID=A0AAX6EI73_IRIPA|nr:ETHYLENE-INSENSITIVE3-like 1 protein isoform X1 [Iris pallida]
MPVGSPSSAHQPSSVVGHHGGGAPFSRGKDRWGGVHCGIIADRREPSVESWNSFSISGVLEAAAALNRSPSRDDAAAAFSALYFATAAGPLRWKRTFSCHQPFRLAEATLTGLPFSGMMPYAYPRAPHSPMAFAMQPWMASTWAIRSFLRSLSVG